MKTITLTHAPQPGQKEVVVVSRIEPQPKCSKSFRILFDAGAIDVLRSKPGERVELVCHYPPPCRGMKILGYAIVRTVEAKQLGNVPDSDLVAAGIQSDPPDPWDATNLARPDTWVFVTTIELENNK